MSTSQPSFTPGQTLGRRYAVERVLKQAHEVHTLLGRDRRTGAAVVLKTTRSAGLADPARLRLEHEARVLQALDSPWIAPLLDIGQQDDVLFVVTPFVDGVPLAHRLLSGPLSLQETLTVARCIFSALACAHDVGVLHGDVKPANVIVSAGPSIESATLVDFGFARSPRFPFSLAPEVAGTVRYMAPEQAGLLERDVDGRTDLYGAGIVLFESLVGRPPFLADDPGELLRQHLSAPVPSLRSLSLRVPRALDEIIQRLLRKDPDDRYHSARGVLADVEAVSSALARGTTEPAVVVGGADRRHILTDPALAGRATELATLEAFVDDARHGKGGLVLLEAESGGGKSRLLDELTRRLAGGDAWVLHGQSFFQAAPRPLQLLGDAIAGIVAEAEAQPALSQALQSRLSDHLPSLAEVIPELSVALGHRPDRPAGPAVFGQERSVGALVALIAALGSPDRPAVLLLDDCQWADDLALRLLERFLDWTTGEDRPPCHTLVIASFRGEDLGQSHPLRHSSAPRLRLGALTPNDVAHLVASMAGSLPEPAVELIQRVSRGNPFMASAALRGLVESGTLIQGPMGWIFDETTAAPQWSQQAAAFLARRLDLISERTRELCSAGAVLGKEFSLRLAASLVGLDPRHAAKAVWEAEDRRLLWVSPDGAIGTFAHDRLRDAFLERMTPGERARLHLHAAEEIEAHTPDRVFELAYHFDAAGHPERALPFAVEAGRQARARHLLELAEVNYRIAERGAKRTNRIIRRRIAEELGRILMVRGRYDEAFEHLHTAASLASDPMERAAIEGELGELAFKRGEVRQAARRLEDTLRLLGERIPGSRLGFLVQLIWEIFIRVVHGLFGRPRRHRSPERARLVAELCGRLEYAWWFGRPSLASLWLAYRQLNVAERGPGGSELGHAYSIHGIGLSAMFPPLYRRGLAFTARARACHQAMGDLWGEGVAATFHAVVLHAGGRFTETIAGCDDAIALLDRAGDPWERNTALWHKALANYRLGHMATAVELAQALHQSGLVLGDVPSRAIGLELWAKASGGAVPADAIASTLDGVKDHATARSALLQADGVRLLAAGQVDEAIDRFGAAVALMRDSGTVNVYLVSSVAWLATAHRQAAETASPLAPAERRRLVRQARRTARRAVRYAWLWPNDRPHALREAAITAALAGRPRRARRRFDRSLAVAERQGALAERAATLEARGRAGLALRWTGAADDIVRAEAAKQGLEQPVACAADQQSLLDVVDRYETILDAGRRITAAASFEELRAAVIETAATLLRAEECTIVPAKEDNQTAGVQGPGDPVAGRSLVEQARVAGRTVVANPAWATEGDPSDSMILSGVRSALCAPIPVHGECAAYLVATHSLVAGLFGDDEVRLVNFVAALAGAALEREELQRDIRARVIAAQEEERARIARDLHDEIGQALTSVLVGVRLMERSLGGDPDRLASLQEMHGVTAEALGQVQQLAFELRPSVLDHGGLVAAIRRLAGDVSARQALRVDVATTDLEPQDRLNPELETTTYRIVQEALTNVVRHAEVGSCSVVLARRGGRLRVVVEDEGSGFEVRCVPASALGLRGMAERAALVGGTLQVTSAPGEGTTIVFDAPL